MTQRKKIWFENFSTTSPNTHTHGRKIKSPMTDAYMNLNLHTHTTNVKSQHVYFSKLMIIFQKRQCNETKHAWFHCEIEECIVKDIRSWISAK